MVAIRTVKVRGGSIFYIEIAFGRLIFFPRLSNSFFFFQKIKRCYLDTEHRGRRGVRAPTQISHSLQYHSVFTLCLLSDKRKNKAVWCL